MVLVCLLQDGAKEEYKESISCASPGKKATIKNIYIYSWIRHQKRTHKTLICCEIKRVTTDLRPRAKSSRRGASIGGVIQAPFSFFRELFWKIDENAQTSLAHGTVGCASSKPLIRRSQILPRCLSCCVSAQKLCQLILVGIHTKYKQKPVQTSNFWKIL